MEIEKLKLLIENITKDWPEWKHNLLVQSFQPKAFEPREPLGVYDA